MFNTVYVGLFLSEMQGGYVMTYNHKAIEEKWQNYWRQNQTFKTQERPGHPKFYALDMFPYETGTRL